MFGAPASYGQPQTRSKVVFVGNLPFDYTEEQFVEVFNSVGPVVSFRLVFDHNTGKPKGFGFCEYRDADTAASALRNLQGVEVGGRGLRLDFADTDDAPPSKRFRGPGGPPMGGAGPAGYGGAYGGAGMGPGAGAGAGAAPGAYGGYQPPGGGGGLTPLGGAAPPGAPAAPLVAAPPAGGYNIPPPVPGATGPRPLPQGVPVEPGKQATDKITETIGTMAPGQLLDIMSQMKALVTASPYEARALLTAQPQLSYALFQAMLCMGIVDPSVLQRAFPAAGAGGAPSAPPAGPGGYPPAPAPAASAGAAGYGYGTPPHVAQGGYGAPPAAAPSSYSRPPPGGTPASYGAPPPPPQQQQQTSGYGNYQRPPQGAPQPPQAQAAPGTTPEQAALIQQVLSMTDAQIAALDETSRNTILQIRQQAQRAMGR
ncbi:hypothetical protein JCM8208_006364 [Rhodotorula glutinis]